MSTPELRKGTTLAAILMVLADGPEYAYRIIQRLDARTRGVFAFKEGLVYPALHKMERDGLLAAEWRDEGGRPRKYYALTEEGRRRLVSEREALRSFADGLRQLLDGTADAAMPERPVGAS